MPVKDATSYLNFAYDCTIGIPDLQVSPESGSKVESLKEIIVGCKDIMDDNGEVIFKVVSANLIWRPKRSFCIRTDVSRLQR